PNSLTFAKVPLEPEPSLRCSVPQNIIAPRSGIAARPPAPGAESVIQCDQVHLAASTHLAGVFQTDQALPRSPLGAPAGTRMIDEDFTHDMGGHGDKSAAILPFRICLSRQLEEGFIDQRRGLK